MKRKLLIAGIAIMVLACSSDKAEEVPPVTNPPSGGNNVTAENVSYKNFAGTFFANKCNACHANGGAGSSHWVFSGYASVQNNAEKIRNAVLVNRIMPQGGSLTEQERTLLDAWFKRNLPEE